jgi:hypothetical protein
MSGSSAYCGKRTGILDLSWRSDLEEATGIAVGQFQNAYNRGLLPSGESTVSRGQIRISPHEVFSPILYKRK